MAQEQRRNTHYSYRKHWVRGTCQSEYVGGGVVAQLIAQVEAEKRLVVHRQAAALRELRRSVKVQAALVLGTETGVRALVTATLLANGFHQHKRQWRKHMHDERVIPSQNTTPARQAQPDEAWQALRAALDIAPVGTGTGGTVTKADEAAAEQQKVLAVRRVLREHPSLWSRARRMISHAERTMIERVTSDGVGREFLETSLKGVRRDLGYETAPPLEKLLIEQIAVAWLDWDIVQQMYANSAISGHTVANGGYWDRRATGAQARYLRAVEALARVRRLARPQPLQVNIGGQQVNVVG